jgi:YggT family protein
MFIVSNLLLALANVIHLALTLYMWLIIARAVVSWIQPNPYNQIVQFLYRATEPVLAPVRRMLPDLGGLDISPVVVIFIIMFVDRFVVATLRQMAM